MTMFFDRMLGDAAAFTQIAMAALGDRLGIWKDLAANGPATAVQLARRMGLSERHVHEWLASMAAADYLAYDATTAQFSLASDRAAVLADETGPMFLGALPELLVSYLRPYERLAETFRTGGGIPQSAFPDTTYRGQERFSAGWYEHLLVEKWLPAAGLDRPLASGLRLCDVGCGGGRALVKLAQMYPASRFVGYDVYGPNVHRARELAERVGVTERVQFHQIDAAAGLPDTFDAITTFDVVRDAADPAQLLRCIRNALGARGTYLCLEIKYSARPDDNVGPIAALVHGCGVLYGMSTSLAHGGAALGTPRLHDGRFRELAAAAGFAEVNKLAVDDPFHNLYTLTA